MLLKIQLLKKNFEEVSSKTEKVIKIKNKSRQRKRERKEQAKKQRKRNQAWRRKRMQETA